MPFIWLSTLLTGVTLFLSLWATAASANQTKYLGSKDDVEAAIRSGAVKSVDAVLDLLLPEMWAWPIVVPNSLSQWSAVV